MKIFYTALFCLATFCMFSCRKSENDINLKTYDDQQIKAYIQGNALTNMQRDLTGGDTTGIYYEILTQGKGKTLANTDLVSYVFTVKSLDGKYVISDTILDHNYAYLGTLAPTGLRLAILNLAKTKGTRARFLIPSHLAYGSAGLGTGSSRLQGNESIDYYINIIDDQQVYDDISIKNYAAANSLNISQFTKTSGTSGIYYKITQAGTGTDAITANSTVYVQFSGYLFNGTLFDQYNDQATTNLGEAFALNNLTGTEPLGWIEPLTKVTAGAKLTLLIPSRFAFGTSTKTGSESVTTPVNSCLRYDINVVSVVN